MLIENFVCVFQNIMEKFNPGARQMINAGKAYLKALHGKLSLVVLINRWAGGGEVGRESSDGARLNVRVYISLPGRIPLTEYVIIIIIVIVLLSTRSRYNRVKSKVARFGRSYWFNYLTGYAVRCLIVSGRNGHGLK